MLEAVSRIQVNRRLGAEEESRLLDELESQECWWPVFRYIESNLNSKKDSLNLFSRLIRIKLQYFSDLATATALAGDLIRQTRLNFSEFREQILSANIIPSGNPNYEVALLEVAAATFSSDSDRIQALERIALIFEKRLFNDAKLHEVFERILKLDSNNVRALRHFKMAFSQSGDWSEVVSILKRLIQITGSEQEKYRLAHDLAHCLVYNMRQPRDALLIIDKHCKGSPLDFSQVEYDAAYRVGDVDRCVRVLNQIDRNIRDDAGRSVINFRLASLYRSLGKLDECEAHLRQCLKYWPVFLDPLEHLVEIYLEKKRWRDVLSVIRELSTKVTDPLLVDQLNQAIKRINHEALGG